MTTIAFLGLGNMGGPMAANLVKAGHTVHGFDPVPEAVKAAQNNGIETFPTAVEAVAVAQVVITMLPNGAIVKQLYDEILPASATGTLFIDSSTISVADAREINSRAGDLGFAQVDAPVSGGVKRDRGHPGVHGRWHRGGLRRGAHHPGSHGGQDHPLR